VTRDAAPQPACHRLHVAGYTQVGSEGVPGLCLDISREDVEVRLQMKYLGLFIDNQWTFGSHFRLLVSNVPTATNTLCGLLLNNGGTEVRVRGLYEGVVRSQVLYGVFLYGIPAENREK
jgi:hypothetical protein